MGVPLFLPANRCSWVMKKYRFRLRYSGITPGCLFPFARITLISIRGVAMFSKFWGVTNKRWIICNSLTTNWECWKFVHFIINLIRMSYDNVMEWDRYTHYLPFVRRLHRELWFPSRSANNAKLCYFPWCWSDQAAQQTFTQPVIWDVKWLGCNVKYDLRANWIAKYIGRGCKTIWLIF